MRPRPSDSGDAPTLDNLVAGKTGGNTGEHPCQRCGRPVAGTLRPDGTPWPFCATCLAAVQRAATPAQPATITLPQLDQAFRTLTALGTFLPAAQEQASAPSFIVALVG